MAYAHRNEIFLFVEPGPAKLGGGVTDKFPCDEASTIVQVKVCELGGKSLLVVGTARNIQVYVMSTKTCVLTFPLPEHDPETNATAHFARGIAAISNEKGDFICVGTSTGSIHVFSVSN